MKNFIYIIVGLTFAYAQDANASWSNPGSFSQNPFPEAAQAACESYSINNAPGEWRCVFHSSGTFINAEWWLGSGTPCDSNPETVWDQEEQSCVGLPDPCDKQAGEQGDPPLTTTSDLAFLDQGGLCNEDNNCVVELSSYTQDPNDESVYHATWQYAGASCIESAEDPILPEIPDPVEHPDPVQEFSNRDDDGDGIPNYDDGDIDGDSTPNSSDPDIDGDGIANADDPTPNGLMPGETEHSSATHGDSCIQRPSCAGDAIQCAQLLEIWRLRCLTEGQDTDGLIEQIPDNHANNLLTQLDNDSEAVADDYELEVTDFIGEDDGMSYDTNSNNHYTNVFQTFTCNNFDISVLGYSTFKTSYRRYIVNLDNGRMFSNINYTGE